MARLSIHRRYRRRRDIAALAGAYAIVAHLLMVLLAPLALAAPDSFGGVLCVADAHQSPTAPEPDANTGHCLFCQARFDVAVPILGTTFHAPIAQARPVPALAMRDARPGDRGGGRPQVPRGPPTSP